MCAQLRGQRIAGGNPVRKSLTKPPVASLGYALVTMYVKRRGRGNRVKRHYSPEILEKPVCQRFVCSGRQYAYKPYIGEEICSTTGSEASHVI